MIAAAAGVIDDAPTFAEAFLRLLQFLLAIFGILVIILLVIAGVLYMTSGGSEAQATLAKKALSGEFPVLGTGVVRTRSCVCRIFRRLSLPHSKRSSEYF
ncbi:MAG: hypothetical protein IPL87_00905 [Candidatus Moraniibacteriota bacterium]|nr:MAG: hypothetical protein IPL87_00905 [Candidatus Moranbacteria bacterium]